MSQKIVKVSNGDYTLSVQTGGNITLDTGARVGLTTITGNLDVQGTVTYIESTNTSINDNIILLNQQETNSYVSLQYSGIEISRGTNNTYGNVRIVYDEKTNINGDGTIALKYTIGGTYVPLETNKITSYGDLILFPGTTTGVVTVDGTTNYESRVTTNTTLTNKKYVDDYVAVYFATHFPNQIQDLNTRVTVRDFATTGLPSEIGFVLDNTQKAKVNSFGITVDGTINLNGSSLSNLDLTSNLILASENGTIEVDGVLQLDDTTGPTAVAGSTKIYTLNSSSPGPGDTGIYFTSYGNSDELIARNRALLWSMLF
jgi:hypothetical protein